MKAKTVKHETVIGESKWYLMFENEETGKRYAYEIAESTAKKIQAIETTGGQGAIDAAAIALTDAAEQLKETGMPIEAKEGKTARTGLRGGNR